MVDDLAGKMRASNPRRTRVALGRKIEKNSCAMQTVDNNPAPERFHRRKFIHSCDFYPMRKLLPFLLLGSALAAAPLLSSAQQAEYDASVKKTLDKADLKYEIDEDGDFKMVIGLGEGRTQLVFVYSSVLTYDGVNVRTIMSPLKVADNREELSEDLLYQLLVENGENKIGSWEIIEAPDGKLMFQYVVKVPTDLNADDLRSMIGLAAVAADQIENKISTEDTY
jgi:hypothetical protein